jgi:hypothetical protein
VRVFVTYETLAQLNPSQPGSLNAALEIFDENRRRIEAAAKSEV